jgi:hypothetical protein
MMKLYKRAPCKQTLPGDLVVDSYEHKPAELSDIQSYLSERGLVAITNDELTLYKNVLKGVSQTMLDNADLVDKLIVAGRSQSKHTMLCPHSQGLTDYCEPCGRVNGGGS